MGAGRIDVDLFHDELRGDALHDVLRRARDLGPLVPVRFGGHDAQLITRFADLRAFMGDQERFPGEVIYQFSTRPNVGPTLIDAAEPEHAAQRQLAMPAFRSRAVGRFVDDQLTPLAGEVLDRLDPNGGDLAASFAHVLPFWAISRKLGLPLGSEEQQRAWALDLLSYPSAPERALAAADELTAFLAPSIAERRRSPADDVISAMLRSEHQGRRLGDEEVAAHVRLLYAVGATTTSDALSTLLWRVLGSPELLVRCVEDPGAIPGIVHESLRMEPPVSVLPRLAVDGGEVAGVEVPPMGLVLCGIASANRDEDVFAQPDRFDPDRAEQEILTFGFGAKYCPGTHLARKQLAAAVAVVADRMDHVDVLEADEPVAAVFRRVERLRVAWEPRK